MAVCVVLIPTLNEPIEVVEPTIRAALGQDWPAARLRVYVCDDGGRDWLEQLCARLGRRGGARRPRAAPRRRERGGRERVRGDGLPRRARVRAGGVARGRVPTCGAEPPGVPHHAKAGNLNHALLEHGIGPDAEFVAVFDADMVASPRFLRRTVPFFYSRVTGGEGGGGGGEGDGAPPRLWARNSTHLVQTPQRFVNVPTGDPLDQGQVINYDFQMPSMDAAGVAPFVGTGALLCARALHAVGGIAYGSLVEDVHTTVLMHMRGGVGRYLHEDLQHGFAPPTLADTFDQRMRWTTGGAQILRLRFLTAAYWFSAMPWKGKLGYFEKWGQSTLAVPLKLLTLFAPLFLFVFQYMPVTHLSKCVRDGATRRPPPRARPCLAVLSPSAPPSFCVAPPAPRLTALSSPSFHPSRSTWMIALVGLAAVNGMLALVLQLVLLPGDMPLSLRRGRHVVDAVHPHRLRRERARSAA